MDLPPRRVLVTGGSRGIGKAVCEAFAASGARVAVHSSGADPSAGRALADALPGGGHCAVTGDVADPAAVQALVAEAVERLGGLDVAIANAGIGAQMPLIDGDASVWDATLAVNLAGTFNLVRAAGPHVSHSNGYFLLTASLAAAAHLPLMAAYCASKAAVESLGNSLRIELRPSGARVGVAYFAELDTDMTSRGFDTKAAKRMPVGGHGRLPVAPVEPAIDAIERGIRRRSRRVVSPAWVGALLPFRAVLQRAVELVARRGLGTTLEIARGEHPDLTTPQPERASAPAAATPPERVP